MRRLSRYIVAEFVGPFLFSFLVITLVLIVDFIPDVVKLVVRKNLDVWIILQVFVLNLAWMLALSIPMAVLSGTLMAYGRLSSESEILAMKASGTSPFRLLLPVMVVALILGTGLIYFNNEILPDANHRARQLMSDIRRTRPTLEIKPNVLSTQIPGYHVLVEELNYETSEVRDIVIFDHKTRTKPRTIAARRGRLSFSADGQTLIVELHDGEIHEIDPETRDKYRRMTFDHQTFYLTGVGSEFVQTSSEYRTDREKSAGEMWEDVNKWRALIPTHEAEIESIVTTAVNRLIAPPTEEQRAQWLGLPKDMRPQVDKREAIAESINRNAKRLAKVKQEIKGIENQERLINVFLLEIHKKYAIPAACLVFVMIGGPLGIIARRGGIGVGLGMSLGLFVLYWAFLIGGEDLADRGLVSPAYAMWAANVLIGIAGIGLIWRVTHDAALPTPRFVRYFPARWHNRFSAEARKKRRAKRRFRLSLHPPGLKRIDTYVLGRFIFNLIWAQAAFWFIFIIIDLVERLDKFIDHGLTAGQITNYYIYYSPYILVLTLPVAMLLATLFCVGFMGRQNELLAIKAGGTAITRLSIPLIVIAFVIVCLVIAAGEYILPWADQHREAWRREKLKGIVDRSGVMVSGMYAQGHDGRFFYFDTYKPKSFQATDVLVQTFAHGQLVSVEEMESLRYEDTVWVARRGRYRIFVDGAGDTLDYGYTPYLHKTFPQWTEQPEDFATRRVSPEHMGYRDLYAYIQAKEAVGGDTAEERTDLHWRFSYPMINVVIVLFGLPIAVRVRQSGMALNFGIAMTVTFVFRVIIEVFRAFGHNGHISPEASAWIPIGIFFLAGVVMLSRVRS